MMKRSRYAQPIPKRVARPVNCDISITRQGQSSVNTQICHFEMLEGSIRDYNRDFIQVMNRVKTQIVANIRAGQDEQSAIFLNGDFYQTVLTELRDAGLAAFTSLGSQAIDLLDQCIAKDIDDAGMKLTIRTDTYPLLWEFIYTGSSRGPVQSDLFWGYRHHIARYLMGAKHLQVDLDCDGGFLFCRHHGLAHWEAEKLALHEIILERLKFIHLDDHMDYLASELANLNLDEQVIAACTQGDFNYIHIASHLFEDQHTGSVLGTELVLSHGTQKIPISLKKLNASLRDVEFQKTPLVFLNACKTMTNPEHLIQGESFPRSFLRLGAGGVIATACDIPDLFAVQFAKKFYEILFNYPLGEAYVSDALRLTRQYFMDNYNNPLGLAYGLYAHNDLIIYLD